MKTKVVDLALEGQLLPPPPDKCQKCAVNHPEWQAHNQQSMYWQYWFYRHSKGRWPTWHDAMAHCSQEIKDHWVKELTNRGVNLGAAAAPAGAK